MIGALRHVRPSTLVMLAAAPFIVYLFAASSDYQRALRAIVGVDIGSSSQVPGFLILTAMFATGAFAAWPSVSMGRLNWLHWVSAALTLVLALLAAFSSWVVPFAHAVVANAVDPFTSSLVMPQVTPRRLTDETALVVSAVLRKLALAYFGFMTIGLAWHLMSARLSKITRMLLLLLNGTGIAFLMLFAYLGFAVGVATTLRAAVFAYGLALILGLLWVTLLQLHASARALIVGAVAATVCMIAASAFLLQKPDEYVVAGNLTGKIGIIKGTPAGLVVDVRFGRFPGANNAEELPIRSFADVTSATQALRKAEGVTAVLLPTAAAVDSAQPILWRTSVLNDRSKTAGIASLVLAIATGLMCFAGFAHGRHPLSVAAEFIIDTIRGIPMLVIVLYVGLPLSGALKDASQGVLDPPNFLRGVVAMAIAYSAYLAEIMRSGIKAIPKGQFEAASSLGLSRFQTARLIVVPQAFRIILPALGNELIAILKDTSLLSILSIRDITQRTREFQSASFLPFAPFNSATIVYVFLTLTVASLLSTIERKHDIKQR